MPQSQDGIYQETDHALTITAHTRPGGNRLTFLCLAGEIDMASSAVLAKTIDWLTGLAPVCVLVDLADLTFAGATLPNFVARIRQAVPDGAEVILCGARPATGWVLRATDMATIATIHAEPAEPLAMIV